MKLLIAGLLVVYVFGLRREERKLREVADLHWNRLYNDLMSGTCQIPKT